jgi:hypothetical protein
MRKKRKAHEKILEKQKTEPTKGLLDFADQEICIKEYDEIGNNRKRSKNIVDKEHYIHYKPKNFNTERE